MQYLLDLLWETHNKNNQINIKENKIIIDTKPPETVSFFDKIFPFWNKKETPPVLPPSVLPATKKKEPVSPPQKSPTLPNPEINKSKSVTVNTVYIKVYTCFRRKVLM